jgi:hypothetical protein
MSDWLGIVGALAVLLVPLALAWWLLVLKDRTRRSARKNAASREKMNR